MRVLSKLILRLIGWRMEGELPGPKSVLIGAPHTSNWDFPLALLCFWSLSIPGRWVAKHTVFRPPVGWLMRRMGGIPLDRGATQDFVSQVVDWFHREEDLTVVIAPSGTRSRTERWRSGFYWIAHGAGVPIALGYMDYARRVGGIGPSFVPTGDIEADMERIRTFYADKVARRPERVSEIRVRAGPADDGSSGGTPSVD
ncbi:MAG: lysophospholipid acyltransferase family protein [Gemmatimonadetes bacterium]|nr:lysophospholipid acyltransferase family protein [Gemmatimonadota bacterium]